MNQDNGFKIFCPRCGNEMNSESRYCMKCGYLNTNNAANQNNDNERIVNSITSNTGNT